MIKSGSLTQFLAKQRNDRITCAGMLDNRPVKFHTINSEFHYAK